MTRPPWPETDVLEQLTSARRLQRIDDVLGRRLTSITVVFEDLYDAHNVAAGLRTCEAYGLHDVHVITEQHDYKLHGDVAASSERWLDVHRYTSTEDCVGALKEAGTAIWVSDLEATQPLSELPVRGDIAIVVGHEHDGITARMRAAADQRYILPMQGMVQSFNVSVALAISLQTIVPVRRGQVGGGDMSFQRQWALRRRWLEHGIRHAKQVRKAYGDPYVEGEKSG